MSLFGNRNDLAPVSDFELEFRDRVLRGDGESVLLLVPNRVATNRIRRDLIGASTDRATGTLPVYTLDEFVASLYAQAFPHVRILSDPERAVLLEEILRELQRGQRLQYFSAPAALEGEPIVTLPLARGTFDLVVNTISRMMASGITPDGLEAEIAEMVAVVGESKTTELRRAGDLQIVYAEYLRRLGDGLTDSHLCLLQLLKRYEGKRTLSEDLLRLFPGLNLILLEGFVTLEWPHGRLLSLFKGLDAALQIRVTGGVNHRLLAAVAEIETRLDDAGLYRLSEDAMTPTRSAFAQELGKHLFSAKSNGQIECGNVDYFIGSDAAGEVREIARRIKQLATSDPELADDLSSIVVAAPDAPNYTPLFQEIFAQFGIPVFIADRYNLDRSAIAQGTFALLEVVHFGLQRESLQHLLANASFRFQRTDGTAINSRALLNVLARHRLSGDAKRVQNQLVELRTKFAEKASEFWHDQVALAEMKEAERDLRQFRSLVQPLMGTHTPSEFESRLRAVFQNLGVAKSLLAGSRSTIGAGVLEINVRAYKKFLATVSEVVKLLERLGLSSERLPLPTYLERLRAATIRARYNPRPNLQAVQVFSLDQSVDHVASYLFVAGLDSELLPREYRPQVLLMQSQQVGEARQIAEERYQFFEAVTNFRKRLCVSYSHGASSGRQKQPSPFLKELVEQLQLVPSPTQRSAQRGTSKAEEIRIASYADLYQVYRKLPRGEQRDGLLAGAIEDSPSGFYRQVLEERVPFAHEIEEHRDVSQDGEHCGQLDTARLTDAERETLEKNTKRVWSVSQLELYARCGFRYFLSKVLRLGNEQEESDGLEDTDRGSLLHEMLRRYMESRVERGIDSTTYNANEESRLLHEVGRKCAAEMEVESPLWRLDSECVLESDPDHPKIIERFVDREAELMKSELRPRFFEFDFPERSSERDDSQMAQDGVPVGDILLRGRIDRIDVDASNRYFAILDYKSGSGAKTLTNIKNGHSMQLPLYLRVAEDVLRSHFPELKGIGGIYYALKNDEVKRELGVAVKEYTDEMYEDLNRKRAGLLSSRAELESLINGVVERASEYVRGIASGSFPLVDVEARKTVCTYCDYRSVCRVGRAEEQGLLRAVVPISLGAEASETKTTPVAS